ncbi:hypothetical protein [Acinetobacter sp. ANC 5378]|nr:hypothetical protein [Acinetobacter sp. ANC 5378]
MSAEPIPCSCHSGKLQPVPSHTSLVRLKKFLPMKYQMLHNFLI